MAETLKFIHTADLHLGAPFRGLESVSGHWASRLMRAIPEAYDRTIEAAIDNQVDFVVIAGDTFDLSSPSYSEFMHFVGGLERLEKAGIPVYMITGNHDPLASWKHPFALFPSNVHVFPADEPGFFLYERNGQPLAVLGGRGFAYQSWTAGSCPADGITRDIAQTMFRTEVPFAIGVLHTGLDIDPGRAPVSRKQLEAAGMDYWALGHIHTPRRNSEANPTICFSGCIQGRATKETGKRGINLVTLTAGQPNKVDFIPTASVVYEKVKVDVSGVPTLASAAELVLQVLFDANAQSSCDEMIERVVLTGATPLHEILNAPGVLEDMRKVINDSYDKFFCDALEDRTKPMVSKKSLRKEGLLPSVVLQVSDEAREHADDDIAYLQECFWSRGLSLPKSFERKIDRLQEEAEGMALDLLGDGEL